jgi:hypothetical protein
VEVVDRPEHQSLDEIDARAPAPPKPYWRGALQPLGLAAIAAAGCAYVAIMNPNESSAYPQCPLRAITGYDCPGCGLTRSVYALLHGDVVRAIDHNLLVVVLLPLALLAFARWTAGRMGYATGRLPRWRPWMTIVAGLAVVSFLIARNLPGFEYLRATAG